jgi:hypothetical protein
MGKKGGYTITAIAQEEEEEEEEEGGPKKKSTVKRAFAAIGRALWRRGGH